MARRFPLLALHLVFLPLTLAFLIGRLDSGFASAVLSPWVVQSAAIFLLLAVAAVFLRRPLVATAAVGCAAWGGSLAVPTLLPHEGDVQRCQAAADRTSTRVLFANVCNHSQPTAEAIEWMLSESPDLVGVAELTDAWRTELASLEASLPYTLICPQAPNVSGIALYSRYPIHDARVDTIVPGSAVHVEAIVELPGGPARVYVIHPPSPRSAERMAIRDASLKALAERCAAGDLPTVVMGDFNETPFGQPFQSFIESTGYRPARDAAGFTPSWPTTYAGLPVPEALRIPIDHVIASDHFVARACRVGKNIRSDHMPIVADLVLVPGAHGSLRISAARSKG